MVEMKGSEKAQWMESSMAEQLVARPELMMGLMTADVRAQMMVGCLELLWAGTMGQ